MSIAKIMSSRLVVANSEDYVQSAVDVMVENNVGAVLITIDGKVGGIFTERDLLFKVVGRHLDPQTTLLQNVMTSPVLSIQGHITAEDALRIMQEKRIRHLPVVDGNDNPIGMLGIRDVMEDMLVLLDEENEKLAKLLARSG